MITRPVDANDDMLPVVKPEDMLTGAKAVARVVKSRIQFAYGQWWEDETMGFEVPDFLRQGLRRNDVDMLTRYITSYVLKTEGVGSVTDVKMSVNGREAVYSCRVIVEEESENVEVSLNAVY